MDSSDAKKAQKNGDHLQDVVQVENPSEPTDDYEWLEKSIDTEVSHGVLPDDHDKKALSASREDPTGQKGLSEMIIIQNKPKKSMSSPVAPEGIDIFYLMD
jgi:hypothetical protein